MKVLIVIFAIVSVWKVDARAIIAGSSEQLAADEEACIAELNLNKDQILIAAVNKIIPENNDEYNKLTACTGKKQGLLSPKGEINYEKFTDQLLKIVRTDLEASSGTIDSFKQVVTSAVENCKQHSAETNQGLSLIKTMNCVSRNMEKLTEG